MKKIKLNLILLIALVPLLTFCGGVRDALEGKKRSEQSDEFLVKKKNPLQMPPDMNKLPMPGDDLEVSSQSNDKEVKENSFDIVFDTVGLEVSRQQAISVIKPGGSIIHIGLTQPSGQFNFRKATLQEVTFIGTYCYTNKDFEKTIKILADKEIGDLSWIEYRELKKGAEAFKQIHDGSCSAPKIVLLP